MQFNFKETDESREEYRFGGRLTLVAENIAESAELVDHFKLHKGKDIESLQARISALQDPSLSVTIGTDKRPAYCVETSLPWDFSKPYADWMSRDLGYDGPLPDLDIPRQWGGLKHTNYQAELRLQGEHITFIAYTTSEPWNKKDAQTYAESRVADCISEEFGERYHEPEYIQAGNNMMVRNPDYLKRRKPTPAASNSRLKRALFEWWLSNEATEAQREIVAGNAQIVAETGGYMGAFDFERPHSTIYHGRKMDKDGKTQDYLAMSFSDFARLGKEVSA